MNVQVDSRGERLIEREIQSGRYRSAEEVVAHALEALSDVEPSKEQVSSAVRDMLNFAAGHGYTLGEGVRAKDLVHEH